MHRIATSEQYRGNSPHHIAHQWSLLDCIHALILLDLTEEIRSEAERNSPQSSRSTPPAPRSFPRRR